MATMATGKTGDFELAPLGPQQAVCVFVEDIGTHEHTYNGETKRARQVVLCFELAERMTKGDNNGKPFMLSNFYTLSLHEKARLSKDIEAWFGKKFTPEQRIAGFDLDKLKGHNCFLNVVEKQKANGDLTSVIGGIMPLSKNMPKINPVNMTPPAWIAKKRGESFEARGTIDAGIGEESQTPPGEVYI